VVRVAGNVLGPECLGSLQYAAANLSESLRLVVVLGHGGCGAVAATVDAFLDPVTYPSVVPTPGLRSVVDHIFISVRAAADALRDAHGAGVTDLPGYRAGLLETSVAINAGLVASTVDNEIGRAGAGALDVVYGVYDLKSGKVWAPSAEDPEGEEVRLAPAPSATSELERLAERVAGSRDVRGLLEGGEG